MRALAIRFRPLDRPARAAPRAARAQGRLRVAAVLAVAGLLAGCNLVIMNPSGDIAVQQRNLIIASTALMLLVIVPVIALTFLFAWRYRASNTDATYDPDWHHSTQLEVVIWTVPAADHHRARRHDLDQHAHARPLPAAFPPRAQQARARRREAAQGRGRRARLEMAVHLSRTRRRQPERDGRAGGRADHFRITSSSVWNTFYVPALAGMIYAMPGMETKLHAVMNKEGEFTGLSGHYSGSGFSRMNFAFRGLSQQGFDEWVAKAKAAEAPLDRAAYLKLEKPSEAEPVRYFGSVENGLYDAILGLCVQPGQMCVQRDAPHRRMGGAGKDSEANRKRLDYDNRRLESGDEPAGATFPASAARRGADEPPEGMMPRDGGTAASGGARP